jgi:hypothetical protein
MKILARHPARTGNLTPQAGQAFTKIFGQTETDEQPDHSAPFSSASMNRLKIPV